MLKCRYAPLVFTVPCGNKELPSACQLGIPRIYTKRWTPKKKQHYRPASQDMTAFQPWESQTEQIMMRVYTPSVKLQFSPKGHYITPHCATRNWSTPKTMCTWSPCNQRLASSLMGLSLEGQYILLRFIKKQQEHKSCLYTWSKLNQKPRSNVAQNLKLY